MYISLLIVWGSSALYLLSISITYMRHGSLIYWWLNTPIPYVHYKKPFHRAKCNDLSQKEKLLQFIYIYQSMRSNRWTVYNTDERVCTNRLAMDTFWRTFHHDGINSVHALPLSTHLPSRYTPPISLLPFSALLSTSTYSVKASTEFFGGDLAER